MTAAGFEPPVVGPLERRHLRSIMRIDALVYPTTWSRNLWLHELSLEDSRCYIGASRAGRLVGHGGLLFAAGDAHVTTLAVDPAHQGSGVGSHLMLSLARAAVDAGMTALTLEVRGSNERAQRLYRRFGMAPAGIRRGYYEDPGGRTDALIMWAHDIDLAPFRVRLEEIAADLGRSGSSSSVDEREVTHR